MIEIALVALEFGRSMLEAGASAHRVDEITAQVAIGLGAERVDLRVGYASLTITVGLGSDVVTRVREVGPLGVNERRHRALGAAAAQIGTGSLTATQARTELANLLHDSPPYPDLIVAIAVGVACAAFGRLLGVDWAGVGPIFIAAALSQMIRRQLALHNLNAFISVAAVAFLGSVLSGFGARWVGSQTVTVDIIATVLFLVPGVPSFNAQYDILGGHPTLGCARAVLVLVTLVFMTMGVWLAQGLLG